MNSQLPLTFATSVEDFERYPENLVNRTTYPGALKAHKTQLDAIERRLFTTKAVDINVPFRDSIGTCPGLFGFEIGELEMLIRSSVRQTQSS